MGILGCLFGFIYISLRREEFIAYVIFNKFCDLFVCLIGNTYRVSSDIGYKTYCAFTLYLNTFIKLLGKHHCFLSCKVQIFTCFLLECTCCKRRIGFSYLFASLYLFNNKVFSVYGIKYFISVFLALKLDFSFCCSVKLSLKLI